MITIDDLTDGSLVVLAALIRAVDDATAGEFGFMDEAYCYLDSDRFSKHAFAGHVSALGRFIDWSVDLSCERWAPSSSVQFNVTRETWAARLFIYDRAEAAQP